MNKYAYNFAEKKKSKVLQGGVLDFDKLLKGYYDDIENIDSDIKNSRKMLDITKDWTIKSCAYSNLDVPSTWRNKLEYPKRMMKLMNNDNTFFNYLTKVGKSEENNQIQNNLIEAEDTSFNKEETKNGFSEQPPSRGRPINRESSNFKNEYTDLKFSPVNTEEAQQMQKSSSRISPSQLFNTRKNSISNKNAKAYTSKEIREILDNYNDMYKSKKVPKENIENSINVNKDKHIILPNLMRANHDQNRGISMIDNLNSTQKSQLFKSTIYNSMIPVKLNKIQNEAKPGSTEKTKKNQKSKTEYGPFLNFNYEEFNKKIEISNPEVKRLLEDINYYGPHFSHCPSCRNKNLEFYETLEPSQCINLLQFIKKSKKKNKK